MWNIEVYNKYSTQLDAKPTALWMFLSASHSKKPQRPSVDNA